MRETWRTGTGEPNAKGYLRQSDCTLSRIHIASSDYQSLARQIEKLVVRGSNKRAKQWRHFKDFIASHSANKFNVFIDGANVGFYGQNKGGVYVVARIVFGAICFFCGIFLQWWRTL